MTPSAVTHLYKHHRVVLDNSNVVQLASTRYLAVYSLYVLSLSESARRHRHIRSILSRR